jgi:hypothetical protein
MSNAMSALWASIVRTVVPIVVGAVLAFAVAHNIPLDKEFESLLSIALAAAFTAAYYVVVRLLETYVAPKLGWLLGLAKTPTNYSPKHLLDSTSVTVTVNAVPGQSNADLARLAAAALRTELGGR